ncbi:hypothetical protein ASG76_13590 [Nocardioides sp. Soil774]|uniref:ATP-binding protein n=1 Tax=Nocardioides sp. Soil774 TaxID=1736408 RepID=UPI0006F89497|nr:helix-turn-helix domain-containing protein [Nocardioides sp. Soil774]KRE93486.1 hypothetical protein ASG76_13590 [Nocardioides sp. Soil774]
MGALPQPVVAPGPHRELVDTLHSLHHRAGWPSLRQLARETGVSHTTVSKVLSSATLPAWGNLELLTEALHGDVAHMHDLWLAASTPADTDDASVARIAGRVDEIAALRRHLETGAGMLLVTGEAGMGKTTLVDAAAESVDTVVAVGRCLQLSSEVPLLPFIDALRSLHQVDAGRWMEEALADCPTYVRASLGRLVPELLPGSTPTSVADDPWGQERLFSSVTAVLSALAATRPLALHLEDCHWADRGTLDLLTHMASHPSGVPVVVTWRSGDPDVAVEHSEWLLRNRWAPGVDAIDLRPMTLEETARQLQLITGARVDDEVARTIHARGQGLPLYTAQLATVTPGAEMPRHLAELLDRRIGELHGAPWRVARLLGVAQRQMTPTTLRAATGLDADEEDEAMHALERRGLLQHSLGGAGLAHPLFIEAIERRLLPGEAADAHARLADALESAPAIQPGEVADHWRAAGRPDREVVLRVAAARRADERFAQQEALDAWLRVLELWDDGHRDGDIELWQVLVLALDVAIGLGDLDAGRVLAARAASLDLPAGPREQVLQRVGSFL